MDGGGFLSGLPLAKGETGIKTAVDIIKGIKGRLAAGISGGADSMCLLSLVLTAGKKDDVIVLHIDHGIRATAGRDCRLVQDFCESHGIKIEIFKVDVPALAKQNSRSIETQARISRHEIFDRFCKENNVPLLLAHNLGDNVESILMHIFRGCGLRGLTGMNESGGGIIRPLISTSKDEIYRFCKENNVPFAEDETNADTSYRRNHIRSLIPEIEKSFPGVRDAVLSLSRIAAKTEKYIQSQLCESYFMQDGDAVLLDKRAFETPLAAEYAALAIHRAGLKTDLEEKHILSVVGLAGLDCGKSIDLPHGLRAYNEEKHLAFEFAKPLCADVQGFVLGSNEIGGKAVIAKLTDAAPQKGRIVVDADCLDGAELRFRREGDRFCACGGKPKKLKEFLNGKKIPNRKKDFLPLIARGNEVLVVCGVELADCVKITDKTKRAVEIVLE